MILDSVILDSLITWAKLLAPLDGEVCRDNDAPPRRRRRVRLEITAESHILDGNHKVPIKQTVMCRVYLAEPNKVYHECKLGKFCELCSLAEMRIE